MSTDLKTLKQEYLEYLEESFLIKKLYNYSRNARKTQRRLKKYYSTLINPLLIKNDFGKIFEQALVIQLDTEFFWRDSYKNEVDVVQLDPLIAIEIKSGDVKERDLNSLKRFIKKFKPKEAIVLSQDIEKEIDEASDQAFGGYETHINEFKLNEALADAGIGLKQIEAAWFGVCLEENNVASALALVLQWGAPPEPQNIALYRALGLQMLSGPAELRVREDLPHGVSPAAPGRVL